MSNTLNSIKSWLNLATIPILVLLDLRIKYLQSRIGIILEDKKLSAHSFFVNCLIWASSFLLNYLLSCVRFFRDIILCNLVSIRSATSVAELPLNDELMPTRGEKADMKLHFLTS